MVITLRPLGSHVNFNQEANMSLCYHDHTLNLKSSFRIPHVFKSQWNQCLNLISMSTMNIFYIYLVSWYIAGYNIVKPTIALSKLRKRWPYYHLCHYYLFHYDLCHYHVCHSLLCHHNLFLFWTMKTDFDVDLLPFLFVAEIDVLGKYLFERTAFKRGKRCEYY